MGTPISPAAIRAAPGPGRCGRWQKTDKALRAERIESGVLSSRVLEDIGDAIRAQNGTEERYAPSEMAAAILALAWEAPRARALLLADGTLEFNFRAGERSDLGDVSYAWEVDPAGYASASARPWHSRRDQVARVAFDADFAGAGVTNLDYWFNSQQQMTEIAGFENLPGLRTVNYAFVS